MSRNADSSRTAERGGARLTSPPPPPSLSQTIEASWTLLCMLFPGTSAHDGIDCTPKHWTERQKHSTAKTWHWTPIQQHSAQPAFMVL